jgi:hypothetical protein
MKLKYVVGSVDTGVDLHLLEEAIINFKTNSKITYESNKYTCRFVQSTICYETLRGFETEIILEIKF